MSRSTVTNTNAPGRNVGNAQVVQTKPDFIVTTATFESQSFSISIGNSSVMMLHQVSETTAMLSSDIVNHAQSTGRKITGKQIRAMKAARKETGISAMRLCEAEAKSGKIDFASLPTTAEFTGEFRDQLAKLAKSQSLPEPLKNELSALVGRLAANDTTNVPGEKLSSKQMKDLALEVKDILTLLNTPKQTTAEYLSAIDPLARLLDSIDRSDINRHAGRLNKNDRAELILISALKEAVDSARLDKLTSEFAKSADQRANVTAAYCLIKRGVLNYKDGDRVKSFDRILDSKTGPQFSSRYNDLNSYKEYKKITTESLRLFNTAIKDAQELAGSSTDVAKKSVSPSDDPNQQVAQAAQNRSGDSDLYRSAHDLARILEIADRITFSSQSTSFTITGVAGHQSSGEASATKKTEVEHQELVNAGKRQVALFTQGEAITELNKRMIALTNQALLEFSEAAQKAKDKEEGRKPMASSSNFVSTTTTSVSLSFLGFSGRSHPVAVELNQPFK